MKTERGTEQHWPDALPSPERERMVLIARQSWRDLGFWYDCDPAARSWTFRADANGARRFAALVRKVARLPDDRDREDHVHLGPFSHLRIIRGDRPSLSARGVAGRPADLDAFAGELDAIAASGLAGVHPCAAAFAVDQGYSAVLVLEPDGFDPASADVEIDC